MQHPFLRHSAQNWTRTCGFCYRERRRRHVSITWPTNASLTSNCTNNSARYSLPLSWCHSAVCFASSLWGLLICMNFGPAHFSCSFFSRTAKAAIKNCLWNWNGYKKGLSKSCNNVGCRKREGRRGGQMKAVVTASWKPNKPRHTPHIERYAKLNKVLLAWKT